MKTLKVIVDYELCEANALCIEAAPEVFELDGDDKLHLLQEHPPESLSQQDREGRPPLSQGRAKSRTRLITSKDRR